MKSINDLTIIIPVRIDSPERLGNLQEIIRYFQLLGVMNIYVIEADTYSRLPDLFVKKQFFVHDSNPVFYRTHYINCMVKIVTTLYVGVWDSDVLLAPEQLDHALEVLRSNKKDMVIPYDGRCWDISQELRLDYLLNKNITWLKSQETQMTLRMGQCSWGGAFLVNLQKYMEAGLENENFYGWGHEDLERVKRWEILGYRIGREMGALYHLFHPRLSNSIPVDFAQNEKNLSEFLKICSMNTYELRKYVDIWRHECAKC